VLIGFAKALLEVGDDFERAIQAVPKDGGKITDPEAVLKTLVEGQ
jgi:molecular chaperone GrpE (heat shock protein)